MKITSITARNFKCGSFDTPLKPITVITGLNGAGKTSRLDALQLALCGYHPRLKKQNEAIMGLACGPNMSVMAVLEDGRMLTREWKRRADKIVADRSAVCDTLDIPQVLIDPEAYFALSDKERVKYVFGLVPMPESQGVWSEITAALKNHVFVDNNAMTEDAIKNVIALVEELRATKDTIQDQMEAIVDALKLKKKDVDAAVKRMTGTVQGVTELAGEAVLDPTPEINVAKAKLEQLLAEQRDLQNAITRAKEVQAQREKIEKQIEELQNSVHPAVKDQLENEVEQLFKVTGEYLSHTEKLDAEYASLRASADKARADGQKIGMDGVKATNDAQTRTRLETELATAQQEALGLAELEAELAKKQERQQVLAKSSRIVDEDIPFIKRAITGTATGDMLWRDEVVAVALQRMLDNNATQIIETGTLMAQVSLKRLANGKASRLNEQIAALPPKPDLEALSAALEAKRTEFKELAAQLLVIEEKLKQSRVLDSGIAQSRLTLAKNEAELSRLNDVPKRVKELEEQLFAQTIPAVDGNKFADVQHAIGDTRLTLTALDTRYKQFIAQKSEAATKLKALNQRLLLEAESAACKVAVELVQEQQAQMVATAFHDILLVANQVTKDVLKGELCYENGEIGMWSHQGRGQWITTRTMSGSEQLCALAAISVSLAAKSPVRVLLLDEAGRIDAEHSVPLIRNLCTMIESGALDNVLLTGLVAPEMPAEVAGSSLVSVVNL